MAQYVVYINTQTHTHTHTHIHTYIHTYLTISVKLQITFIPYFCHNFKVHVYCIVRELPDVSAKDRVKKTLQKYKILPATDEGYQMNDEEKYLDFGFENRVTFIKGRCKKQTELSHTTLGKKNTQNRGPKNIIQDGKWLLNLSHYH